MCVPIGTQHQKSKLTQWRSATEYRYMSVDRRWKDNKNNPHFILKLSIRGRPNTSCYLIVQRIQTIWTFEDRGVYLERYIDFPWIDWSLKESIH